MKLAAPLPIYRVPGETYHDCHPGARAKLVGDYGLRLDFHFPTRVQQAGDDNHAGGRASSAEKFPVHRPNCIGVANRGYEHTGAHYVGQAGPEVAEGRLDDLEAPPGLKPGVGGAGPVRPHRGGPGDDYPVAYAGGPAVPDRFLERRTRRHPFATGHA